MSVGVPSRTITLLFTDIEESTRLLRELGEGYAELLAEHRRVLREAFALNRGREVDTQGDAFFCVFDSAHDAVAAAVVAQRALSGPDWPLQTRVRVRMGIDTGEPSVSGDAYIGLAVHRAARVCSAANGGQVLLSSAASSVLGEAGVAGTAVRDLGEHRLKDFDRPERLYQLLIDGLPSDLRPPRTGVKQGADAVVFTGDEDRLADAVEAAVTPARSASERAGDTHRWRRSIAPATAAVMRSPLDLTVLALLALLGAAYTPWLFAVAIGAAVTMVAVKASSHRRAAVDSMGLRLYALRALAPDAELADRVKELGALLVRAGMATREADDCLAHYDRHALAQDLHDRRAAAISAADGRRIDSLAQALDALDMLMERRRALAREVREVEAREDEIRSDLFKVRLGRLAREVLASTLVSVEADVEDAVTALQQELATARTLIAPDIPRRTHRRRRRGVNLRLRPRSDAAAAPASPALDKASKYWSEAFVERSRRR
jgi:class 3 adenylate cyclase